MRGSWPPSPESQELISQVHQVTGNWVTACTAHAGVFRAGRAHGPLWGDWIRCAQRETLGVLPESPKSTVTLQNALSVLSSV